MNFSNQKNTDLLPEKYTCFSSSEAMKVGIVICLSLCCALFAITNNVLLGQQLVYIDRIISTWVKINQKPDTNYILGLLTYIGERKLLMLVMLISTAILIYLKKKLEAVLLNAGCFSTALSVYFLKYFIGRPGPMEGREIDHGWSIHNGDWAFPSGHTTMTTFIYIFLGYLLLKFCKNKFVGATLFISSIFISLLVGATRLYLNAHWFSDVLAAYVLSGAYLSLFITILEVYYRSHRDMFHRQ